MQSEVFGLNNLFVALSILFAVRFGARTAAAVAVEENDAREKGKDGGRQLHGKVSAAKL